MNVRINLCKGNSVKQITVAVVLSKSSTVLKLIKSDLWYKILQSMYITFSQFRINLKILRLEKQKIRFFARF